MALAGSGTMVLSPQLPVRPLSSLALALFLGGCSGNGAPQVSESDSPGAEAESSDDSDSASDTAAREEEEAGNGEAGNPDGTMQTSSCDLTYDYEGPGGCVPLTICHPGEYITQYSTPTSDRSCSPCPEGQTSFEINSSGCHGAGDGNGNQGVGCVPGDLDPTTGNPCVCDTGFYNFDTQNCQTYTECPAGTYMEEPGGEFNDHQCAPCPEGTWSGLGSVWGEACVTFTTCEAGSFVDNPGSKTTDRTCQPCPEGTDSFTENATTCDSIPECDPGFFTNDSLECEECPDGTYSDTKGASSCTPHTDCVAGEFEITGASQTQDRTCGECSTGTFTDDLNQPMCEDWFDCEAGWKMTNTPSTSVDRICERCPHETDSFEQNVSECTHQGQCPPGTIQSAPADGETPPICDPCATGTYCAGGTTPPASCSTGTWDHDANPATVCVTKKTCGAGTEIDSEGSTTTDRSCVACEDGWYSLGNNADCATHTPCTHYIVEAGTAEKDNLCAVCPAGQWLDGSCTDWSDCSPGTYVSVAGTDTADRSCLVCGDGTYADELNSSVCQPHTECPVATAESLAASKSADRQCAAWFGDDFDDSDISDWSEDGTETFSSDTPVQNSSKSLALAVGAGGTELSIDHLSCQVEKLSYWAKEPLSHRMSLITSDYDWPQAGVYFLDGKWRLGGNKLHAASATGEWGLIELEIERAADGTATGRGRLRVDRGTWSAWTSLGHNPGGGREIKGIRFDNRSASETVLVDQLAIQCLGEPAEDPGITCVPGTYLIEGASPSCGTCASGTFTDENNLTACMPHRTCTNAETASSAGTTSSDAVCSADFQDYFDDGDSNGWSNTGDWQYSDEIFLGGALPQSHGALALNRKQYLNKFWGMYRSIGSTCRPLTMSFYMQGTGGTQLMLRRGGHTGGFVTQSGGAWAIDTYSDGSVTFGTATSGEWSLIELEFEQSGNTPTGRARGRADGGSWSAWQDIWGTGTGNITGIELQSNNTMRIDEISVDCGD